MRRVVKEHPDIHFIFAVHMAYVAQVLEACFDLSRIRVIPLQFMGKESVEVWKNLDGRWETDPKKNDYVGFGLEHFDRIAATMGICSPLKTGADFLFDYPSICGRCDATENDQHYKLLVVNSAPLSGQYRGYNLFAMDDLIYSAQETGLVAITHPSRVKTPNVYCTMEHGLTIGNIGNISLHCDYIVAVSTGPSWPTFNIWNQESVKLRILLIDHEDLTGIGKNVVQTNDVLKVEGMLKERGFL